MQIIIIAICLGFYGLVALFGFVLIGTMERRARKDREAFTEKLRNEQAIEKKVRADYEVAKKDLCNLAQVSVNEWVCRASVIRTDHSEGKGFLTN